MHSFYATGSAKRSLRVSSTDKSLSKTRGRASSDIQAVIRGVGSAIEAIRLGVCKRSRENIPGMSGVAEGGRSCRGGRARRSGQQRRDFSRAESDESEFFPS